MSLYISPNFDERTLPISLVVLHYTGMKTGKAALSRLCDPTSRVSAHYCIEEDGTVHALVEESKRAWHAGVSYWDGITDVNSASIGIELVNKGHDGGYTAFPELQMRALTHLLQDIVLRHKIVPYNIVGHSDVAPLRKQDPGELFPWEAFAAQGLGLWRERAFTHDNEGQDFYALLAQYGYDVTDKAAAATAFHRHFYTENLGEDPNAESVRRIASLVRQKLDVSTG
jgi:N-acetylmuramoyl-L-alanine amidase